MRKYEDFRQVWMTATVSPWPQNLLFRHKRKLSWFDVISSEVKKNPTNPQNSSVYLASPPLDQLFLYSSFSNNYVYNGLLWYLPHIFCQFLFSTSACLALSLYVLITVNFSNYIKFPICAFTFQVGEELIISSVATLPYLFSACRANHQYFEKPHHLFVLSCHENIFLNLLKAV